MLTDHQRRLYSRQVLLAELGAAGQERLCTSHVAIEHGADDAAAHVASEYLQRAGLQLSAADNAQTAQTAETAKVASARDVARVAGTPELEQCAAWLLGAWAAVETIKRVAGVGTAAEPPFPEDLILNAEVT